MVAKHVNRKSSILVGSTLFLSLHVAALLATFQCCVFFLVFFIDAKPLPKAVHCSGNTVVQCYCCKTPTKLFEELAIEVECEEVQGGQNSGG